jgi:hypothetical protein
MIRNLLLPAFILVGMSSCSVLALTAPMLGHAAAPAAATSAGR